MKSYSKVYVGAIFCALLPFQAVGDGGPPGGDPSGLMIGQDEDTIVWAYDVETKILKKSAVSCTGSECGMKEIGRRSVRMQHLPYDLVQVDPNKNTSPLGASGVWALAQGILNEEKKVGRRDNRPWAADSTYNRSCKEGVVKVDAKLVCAVGTLSCKFTKANSPVNRTSPPTILQALSKVPDVKYAAQQFTSQQVDQEVCIDGKRETRKVTQWGIENLKKAKTMDWVLMGAQALASGRDGASIGGDVNGDLTCGCYVIKVASECPTLMACSVDGIDQ